MVEPFDFGIEEGLEFLVRLFIGEISFKRCQEAMADISDLIDSRLSDCSHPERSVKAFGLLHNVQISSTILISGISLVSRLNGQDPIDRDAALSLDLHNSHALVRTDLTSIR